jgi:serine/threonine-protein kinase HipA
VSSAASSRIAPQRSDRAKLVALLDGQIAGSVFQGVGGQLRFVYDDGWRHRDDAYPLSLSLPLTASEHKHRAINAFLWGLLPDNTRTLDHYGRLFGVSPRSPVALLSHMGVDCAGAVQFAPPDRLDTLLASVSAEPDIEWITEAQVAKELRSVRKHGIPGADVRTAGQFSLAGAQPKIALFERDGKWGRPSGRTPTNRILKPPTHDFEGFAENEHFCLDLAANLRLGAVQSRVQMFEDEIAIVVDRFDRIERDGQYRRVHQEDVCQALGVLPTAKYENEGGPGIATIISLLRESSQEPLADVNRFLNATILNWVLVATDSHAKNYALLHGPRASVRLAPFYDIASFLPYEDHRLYRIKVAMKIGGEYLVRRIGRHQWERLAEQNNLPVEHVFEQADALLQRLPAVVQHVRQQAIGQGLNSSIVDGFAARVLERIETCKAALTPAVGAGTRP